MNRIKCWIVPLLIFVLVNLSWCLYIQTQEWERQYTKLYIDSQQTQAQLNEQQKIIEAYQQRVTTLEQTIIRMNMQNGWKITKAEATAYSPFDNKNGIQASGNPRVTSRGLTPGPHVMAVDPKKIPYGSQLLLIYPDGTMIQGIAGDTGGALRQNKKVQVDVFKYTFEEAKAHGRKDVILLWK